MLLGFKTQLKLNNKQRTLLAQHVGVARHAWNQGLALCKEVLSHNRINPEDKIKFPTAIDLHKWLVASIKQAFPWYYDVSKCAPQYALRSLADAFKAFFKKIRAFPRFKKKGRNDSFTLDGSIKIDQRKVKVPVIGWIKTYERLPHGVTPKSVTISRQARDWLISFKIETEVLSTPKIHNAVGVDLGIKSLATLSTGKVFEGAKFYCQAEKKLAQLQRIVSRRFIGSANYKKAVNQLAIAHQRVANLRKDTLHKFTSYLAKNHGMVSIEDLNVSGMMANRCLAKAVSDMGFYECRRQLEYKCSLYGSKLVVINRWFPSSKTCSCCGTVKDSLLLSERMFVCDSCPNQIDRDLNASINIERVARRTVDSA